MKRLNHERFHKPSWTTFVPEHVRINDEEIKRFVTIVKDVALLSVFSKTGSMQAASILQNLALLRADLVLPSLLDRYIAYFIIVYVVDIYNLIIMHLFFIWQVTFSEFFF